MTLENLAEIDHVVIENATAPNEILQHDSPKTVTIPYESDITGDPYLSSYSYDSDSPDMTLINTIQVDELCYDGVKDDSKNLMFYATANDLIYTLRRDSTGGVEYVSSYATPANLMRQPLGIDTVNNILFHINIDYDTTGYYLYSCNYDSTGTVSLLSETPLRLADYG